MTARYGTDRPDALMTVNETAHLLGIGRSTLYQLRQRGDLRAIKVGARLRFSLRDLQLYIEEHREQGHASEAKPADPVWVDLSGGDQ
jgi:excisionase family DNA binding protein